MRTIRAIQEELEQVKFKLQQSTNSIRDEAKKEQELIQSQEKETMLTTMDESLERVQQITNVRQEIQRLQSNIVQVVESKNQLEDEFTGMVLELINDSDKVETEFFTAIDKTKKTRAKLQEELNTLATKRKEILGITNKVETHLTNTLGPQKAKEVNAMIRGVDSRNLANQILNLFVNSATPEDAKLGSFDTIR